MFACLSTTQGKFWALEALQLGLYLSWLRNELDSEAACLDPRPAQSMGSRSQALEWLLQKP